MTREEAKGYLMNISYQLGTMSVIYLSEKDGEKMREAIKALEQEPCIQEKQANADKIDAVYIDGFKAGYSQARFDLEQEPCEMTAEEYRQRMIQAFHKADCDELIAICVLPTEKEFEHLEWLLEKHYKAKPEPCEDVISRECNNCAYYVNGANDEACDGCFADEYEHPNFKPKAQYCKDAIKYFNTIYELSQTLGVSYSFIADEIKEIEKALKALPQESCNDAISRQAVKNALYNSIRIQELNYPQIIECIDKLPPVTPAEKVGHWEWDRGLWCRRCSECHLSKDSKYFNYCPNCGAKMEVRNENTDSTND